LDRLNFQNISEVAVCSPFLPPNALRAILACTFSTWTEKIAKRIGTGRQFCTQLSILDEILLELLRFASFLTFSSAKNEEVSWNFIVLEL